MSGTPTPVRVERIAMGVSLLASAIWLGGIVVLGAIVAPVVFHETPAPSNADAMTHVFLRFDRVALVAFVLVTLAEVVRARIAPPRMWIERARLLAAALAGGLAIVQATWLSPTIAELHGRGAIRGFGELGTLLDVAHHRSELCGKSEVALLVAFVMLAGWRASSRRGGASRGESA